LAIFRKCSYASLAKLGAEADKAFSRLTKERDMFASKKRTSAALFGLLVVISLIASGCAQATPAATPTNFPVSTPLPPPATYTPGAAAAATVAPTVAPAATVAPAGQVNAFGVTLPADAAPPEKQFIRLMANERTVINFAEDVYNRTDYADMLATPLVRIDKNFEIVPAGAESWEVSSDGLSWTYHLDKNLKWSDGNPVIADDYVFTFQYQADPKHAWDFTWFWSPIKNWDKAVAGDVPVTDIGVKAVDDYTLQFTTELPAPYFAAQALYARPLSHKAFIKSGEFYDSNPATAVSSSPWILTEWTKGKQMVFSPNLKYTGKDKPYLEKIILVLGDASKDFVSYQANEVDLAANFTPADITLISNDPALSQEYHPGFGDFRTDYLGFDTYHAPFNDLKVRQAFAKAIDRASIINNIVHKQGIAAYSFLMPGFPDSSSDVLAKDDVNIFDPAAAKMLLADAGFPDGKGFPKLTLMLRQENDTNKAVANAIVGMLKDNLGVEVEVSNIDSKTFMADLNAHKTQFYMVSYGFDYLDASNMLGVWLSKGRHAWKNDPFDKLVNDATSFVGDPAQRSQMFKDAEKILVDDVGGIFLIHRTPGDIYRPYLKGSELEPDKTGVATWHWPAPEDISTLTLTLYISKDVDQYRK
jgi:ABC-type transport system substrate-binding protein